MKPIKLGFRLEQLKNMVSKNYDHIWDCCCDHGLLGMALLQETQKTQIYFVDVIQPIVEKVKIKLERFYSDEHKCALNEAINKARWHALCQDTSEIKLNRKESSLVIIAGVGGEKTIDILSDIFSNNQLNNVEFLLCPVHQNYRLREYLAEQGFGLIQEKIVKENKRFYELLHVSILCKKKISLVGSEQWDYTREDDRIYLTKMIQHFERTVNDPEKHVIHILEAYKQLLIKLTASD